MMDAEQQILAGVKVLDFTQALAGPTVTRMMVEMGADIVKVEFGPRGDLGRLAPWIRDGRSGYHIQQNRGKRSVCLDLGKVEAIEIVKRLVADVDIVVENFAPGVMAKLGLSYEELREIHPRVIMCSISAMGQDGPLARIPGFDNVAQGYAGVTSMATEPGRSPSQWSVGVGDVLAGVHGLAGINAALYRRERTGRGMHVDVSILDAYFACHEINVHIVDGTNGERKPRGIGPHQRYMAVFGNFRIGDEYLFVGAHFDQFYFPLAELSGREDLQDRELYGSVELRIQNAEGLYPKVQEWLEETFASRDEAIEALMARRIPCAPILFVEEAMAHPHLVERGTVRTVTDRIWGELRIPGFPIRFSEAHEERDLEAPYLGEHNSEVLSGLGYSDDEIAALGESHVLFYREC
jgi:crotonobetainyl-CoA:carnitine CoA-transferase CaiB-like acyl-CoA transferase